MFEIYDGEKIKIFLFLNCAFVSIFLKSSKDENKDI